MAKIRSIIEIHSSRDDAHMRHIQDDQKAPEPVIEEKSDGSLSSEDNQRGVYRSEAVSDRNRMFHSVRQRQGNVRQDVKVEVKIEQQSDQCLSGCFKAIAGCFRRP